MPYHFEVDTTTGVATETWTGTLTVADVVDCVHARRANPEYREETPRLVDLTGAVGNPSHEEICQLAEMHETSPFHGPTAFVAETPLQYGLSRMFQQLVITDRPVEVFRSRVRAMRWLTSDPANQQLTAHSCGASPTGYQ